MKTYLFKIGTFEVRIYSLMYIIALFTAMFLAKRDEVAEKRGMPKKKIEDFAYFEIVSGLIGARIYYVLLKLYFYSQNLSEII